tara:strand:- start:1477 stop:2568 length:1092 start_codon:yes stop_codon:yes gene_type:complete
MKSVFLVHSLRKGGAERLLLELASNLSCTSVTVISWLDNNEFLEEEYQRVEVISLIKGKDYKWPFSLFTSSKKLRHHLEILSPDNVIVFSHSVFWLAYLSKYKTKYIYSIQGFSQLSTSRGYKKYLYRIIDVLALRNLKSSILVPTKELYKESKKYFGVNAEDIKTIPNGVEVGSLGSKDLEREEIVITMLGTISEHKGQHLAVDVIKRLKEKTPNIILNIIGEGSMKDDLVTLIELNNLSNNINLLGRRDDAFELMNQSDIFLHLSLSEGMPLSVIEAMMCSLPVVAFNVSGVRDVVKNNGFLSDYGDTKDIAANIYELIKDKDLRKDMSKLSKDIALRNFDKKKMLSSYEVYLQRLIESNN